MRAFDTFIIINIFISLLALNIVSSQTAKCNKDNKCFQSLPCCSDEGNCGITYPFCNSHRCTSEGNFKNSKCLPPPPCKSQVIKIDPKRITTYQKYNGSYIDYDFVARGDYEVKGGELIVKMSTKGKGSTMLSTRYINYGKITAVMKTSRGNGVVSSFNTMSDVLDEIDFEWVGSKLERVESNWYYRGEKSPKNGGRHDMANSYDNYHSYTIDWNESRIKWLVDGKEIREAKNEGKFPSTPSPYEFGLWDAESLGEGTRDWAGGAIDWNSEDMKRDGYYSIKIKEFRIECYGPTTANDSDFDFLANYGQVYKGQIKAASVNRTETSNIGNMTMFDQEDKYQKEVNPGQRGVVKNVRTESSNGLKLDASLLVVMCSLLATIINL